MVKWASRWMKLYHHYHSKSFYKYYKYKQSTLTDWRLYIENEISQNTYNYFFLSKAGLACFNKLLKLRCVLVMLLMVQAIPLFGVISTDNVFNPRLDWKCITEQHNGLSSICTPYQNRPYKRSFLCQMQHGIDFEWNNSYVDIPVVEFNAYCPLERGLEPKLVNFLGAFCGSLIGGIFIDTLGRKNMALITYFFGLVSLLTYHISSNIIMYTYQEFIKGFFGSIAATAMLTWVTELSSAQYSSATVTSYFLISGLGQLMTITIIFVTRRWRVAVIIISAVGFGLIPLLYFVPPSTRWCVAKGKLKLIPKNIQRRTDFTQGFIYKARAKDCLSAPQTNRLYATNAAVLLLVGYAIVSLETVIFLELEQMSLFQQQSIHNLILLLGYAVAVGLSFLPHMMYIMTVFMLLLAGILCIVATSSDWAFSIWSISRVFTASAQLLVAAAFSLTMTTMKQVPTLNRGFYTSSLFASFQLGNLLNVIIKSRCLQTKHEDSAFCQRDRDTRLLIAGIILLLSVALAFLNTCLTRPISLPHSYEELQNEDQHKDDVILDEEGERSV